MTKAEKMATHTSGSVGHSSVVEEGAEDRMECLACGLVTLDGDASNVTLAPADRFFGERRTAARDAERKARRVA